MKLLTKDEKKFVIQFLKWALAFLGCCGIYMELVTVIRSLYFQYPIEWHWLIIFFPIWIALIYIGRKELPFRSIYFWLIFLVIGVIGVIRIFFYENPNIGTLLAAFFIFAIFVFLFNTKKQNKSVA